MFFCVALAVARPLPAPSVTMATPLTLDAAIAMAQQRGPSARSAERSREAARYRDRAYNARLLPQLSLTGDAPSYSRAIIPVLQPDDNTRFAAQQQRQSSLGLQVGQRLPFTGGDLFIQSGVTNINILGQQDTRLWRTNPVQLGIRQPIVRLNALAWDNREQDIRIDAAEQQYPEAREGIAQQTASLSFDLFAARTALANAQANADVNDTLLTLNRGRYEVGRIGENDLLQSELQVLRARNALDAARLAEQRAEAALRLQLGLPSNALVALSVTNAVPVVVVDTTVAVAQALRNGGRCATPTCTCCSSVGWRRRGAIRAAGPRSPPASGTARPRRRSTTRTGRRCRASSSRWVWRCRWCSGGRARRRSRPRGPIRTGWRRMCACLREQWVQDARFAALELEEASRLLVTAAKADTVGAKRFEVARNRYSIGRIDISNLYIAQTEKDQALEAYVRALRGYWDAYYRVRRLTLYDFEAGKRIREARRPPACCPPPSGPSTTRATAPPAPAAAVPAAVLVCGPPPRCDR
jgi:outer membrane protein TolC